ncbi:MAG: HisA/HisF-related TIM barrel protein [Eubacterium ramulus]
MKKNLIATIYLKNGKLVSDFNDYTEQDDLMERIRLYNDNGIDKIYLFDLSDNDTEHELNLHTMKEINRVSEIPVYAQAATLTVWRISKNIICRMQRKLF